MAPRLNAPRPIAFALLAGITRQPPNGRISAHSGSTAIFITPAFAQAAGAAQSGTETIIQYLTLFGPILLIMYFMVLRPQQKRAKDQADLIKNIRRGDTIITTGGLIGKVTKVVDDAELEVEIAANVRVRVARPMVTEVRAKGEPVKDATS